MFFGVSGARYVVHGVERVKIMMYHSNYRISLSDRGV